MRSCQPQCVISSCAPDSGHIEWHGRLLRVGTAGDSSEIALGDASEDWTVTSTQNGYIATQAGQISQYEGSQILITNADQGALLSLYAPTTSYCAVVQFVGFDTDGFPIYNNSGCVDAIFNTQLVTTSGSGITSQVTLPDDITYVEPDLQAQDGTYFGIVDYANDPNDYLAKFDASGNIQWSVPNFYAQIATADGGLVAQSGNGSTNVTFDANGSATGQVPSFPTYSWKGAYESGSVESVAIPAPPLATTFAAILAGNLSGNGSALVDHSFGLFWCGSGYGEQGSCTQDPFNVGGGDAVFGYVANPTSANPNQLSDPQNNFSNSHQWVDLIENEAMKWLQNAFSKFPISVQIGSQGDKSCYWLFTCHHQRLQEHTAFVVGDWGDVGQVGYTPSFTSSRVYYPAVLANAEIAITDLGKNGTPNFPPSSPQDVSDFLAILRALGRGIGNTSAHEIGHQLSLPNMDCGNDTSKDLQNRIACDDNYVYVYNFFNGSGVPQNPNDPSGLGGVGAQFKYVGVPGVAPIRWATSACKALVDYSSPGNPSKIACP